MASDFIPKSLHTGDLNMAKIELPLNVVLALFEAASKVRDGDTTTTLQDIGETFQAVFPELDAVCSTIEPWQRGKTASGTDNLVMAGPGWKVSYKIASDTGEPETALIDRDQGATFVLEGDHREAYFEARQGGMPELLRTFVSLAPEHGAEYTEPLDRTYFARYGVHLDPLAQIVIHVASCQLLYSANHGFKSLDLAKLDDMSESIRTCGKIMNPLRVVTIRSQPGRYQIVDGDLRLTGVRQCNRDGHLPSDFRVPVIVVGEVDDLVVHETLKA